MTIEQKNAIVEAQNGAERSAFVDFTDEQLDVLIEFDLYEDRNTLVADAANQAIKNKLRGICNQAVLAKDKAFRKGQKAVVEALEAEYQKAHRALAKL